MPRGVLDSGWRPAIITICVFFLLAIAASLRWFTLRRDKQPIKGRGFTFVVIIQCVCSIHTIFVAMQYVLAPDGYTCDVVFWYITTVSALYGWVYLARCWRLYFNIKLAEEISDGQIPFLRSTPSHHSRRISVNEAVDGSSPKPNSIGLTPTMQATSYAPVDDSGLLNVPVPSSGSEVNQAPLKTSSATHASMSVKQQNLVNMAVSLNASSSEHNATLTVKAEPSPNHLGVSPFAVTTASPSHSSQPDDQTSLLQQPTPLTPVNAEPVSYRETTAAAVGIAQPTKVDEFQGARSRAHSTASDAQTKTSDIEAARRMGSVVFAHYDPAADRSVDSADGKVNTQITVDPKVNSLPAGWFMEHRHLNSDLAVVMLAAIMVSISLIIAGILAGVTPTPVGDSGTCVFSGRAAFNIALGLSQLTLLSPMFLFFIPRTDGFSIIRELGIGFVGIIVGATVLVLSRIKSLNNFANEVFPLEDIGSLLIAVTCWFSSLVFPLYRSYVLERDIVKDKQTVLEFVPLSAVLEDAEGLELFARHLQSEFSLENLVFWECVEDFRALAVESADQQFRFRLAIRVFDTCIRARSMFEVNLPSMIRKSIIEDLFPYGRPSKNSIEANQPMPSPRRSGREVSQVVPVNLAAVRIDSTFFDIAQRSVFQLMNNDSFVRFRHTDVYKDYVRRFKTRSAKQLQPNRDLNLASASSGNLAAFRQQRSHGWAAINTPMDALPSAPSLSNL